MMSGQGGGTPGHLLLRFISVGQLRQHINLSLHSPCSALPTSLSQALRAWYYC